MVDLSFLEKFTKGDTRKMKRYISIYLSIAATTLAQMQQHAQEQDWEALRIKAHSLKPQADYIGVPQLKAVLVEIEENILERKFANLPMLCDKASALYDETVPVLVEFTESSSDVK